jgi:hypothetical protein
MEITSVLDVQAAPEKLIVVSLTKDFQGLQKLTTLAHTFIYRLVQTYLRRLVRPMLHFVRGSVPARIGQSHLSSDCENVRCVLGALVQAFTGRPYSPSCSVAKTCEYHFRYLEDVSDAYTYISA